MHPPNGPLESLHSPERGSGLHFAAKADSVSCPFKRDEQVFSNQPRVKRMNKGHYRGEDVYRALGQTEAGRYLAVFFIHKLTHEALILSARDMDDQERKSYAR